MLTAADIMTEGVNTITITTPISDVAAILARERFGSLPVVDDAGHVLGIVSEEDFATRAVKVHLPRHIEFLGGIVYLENPQVFQEEAEKILALTAGEIMTAEFVTVAPDATVDALASRMLDDDLRRLLVLDANSRLIGIITRADIVRMLQNSGQLPAKG